MKSSRALAVLCGAAASGCAVDGDEAGETQAALTTLVVDDDRAQCPGAAFATIQAAVDAAPAGSVVRVCAGTYAENVRVEKTMTLRGARYGRDGRGRTLASSGESIVISDRPFFLGADDVVLDGFTVIVVVDESGEGAGIRTSNDFSGYRVINNVADADGVTALFPGSNGARPSVARRNHFYNRLGIAGSPDEPFVEPRNLLIEENLFTRSSILMRGFDVVIRANKLEENGRITISESERITVTGNKILRSPEEAIGVDGASRDVLVQSNVLRNGGGDGIVGYAAGNGLIVADNRIAGLAGAGVHLIDGLDVVVRHNEVEDGGEGIRLTGGRGHVVEANDVEDNAAFGIVIDAAAADNFILRNQVRGNGPPDCRDASTGALTAGTANTWLGNEGSTSDPAGLCDDASSP